MLKPGIMYSTCTFAPLENEKSVSISLDSAFKIIDFNKYREFDDGHPNGLILIIMI